MAMNRGVILAGGNGTRLSEYSNGLNKHAVEVAGRPMIEYPLQTLEEMGITDVTIVTSPSGYEDLSPLVSGVEWRLQEEALGMAHALGCAAVKEDVFVVLCGDCYHDPAPKLDGGVQLWWTKQEAGNNGAVWNAEKNRIVEKPTKDLGGLAIIGARVYDQAAIRMIDSLKPSARGELELVDIDNWYLSNELEMTHYGGFFGDMGTPDGLARVEGHIA
jgi:glucose-1-phosphate thymidylyltransferase